MANQNGILEISKYDGLVTALFKKAYGRGERMHLDSILSQK
ncbi:MAG TPA: hypothetical protein VKV29_02265 [Chthonomonas sp.]|jgi:hypothetical protein|nr:hypothetical protein [Chthonomonas sp.]HLH79089.1 hypothetical protein [Chthonomonas sp.]